MIKFNAKTKCVCVVMEAGGDSWTCARKCLSFI